MGTAIEQCRTQDGHSEAPRASAIVSSRARSSPTRCCRSLSVSAMERAACRAISVRLLVSVWERRSGAASPTEWVGALF